MLKGTYCQAVLYVRHEGRHFSSEGLVQTALVRKHTRDTRGASLCLTSLGQARPVKKPNPTGTRAFQSCAASILSPRHILTPSSNKGCPGTDRGNPIGARALQPCAASILSPRHILTPSSNTRALGPTRGIKSEFTWNPDTSLTPASLLSSLTTSLGRA